MRKSNNGGCSYFDKVKSNYVDKLNYRIRHIFCNSMQYLFPGITLLSFHKNQSTLVNCL